MELVTVSQAIEKGKLQLRLIPQIFTASGIAVIVFSTSTAFNGDTWMVLGQCVAGVMAILLSTVYYLVRLPQWLIWAYSNVRNVHELKQLATLGKIIPESDSWKWKCMIMSRQQRQLLAALEQNFLMPDVFTDNDAGKETVYYYNKRVISKFSLIPIICSFAGFYFVTNAMFWQAIAIVLIGFLFLRATFKQMGAFRTALTISNKGISSPKLGSDTWEDISKERVIDKKISDLPSYWLCYETPFATKEILLNNIKDANYETIIHTLNVYRARYEASKQTN